MNGSTVYKWNIAMAYAAIAEPMLEQVKRKLSRIKLRKKLFKYYKRAKYGGAW